MILKGEFTLKLHEQGCGCH